VLAVGPHRFGGLQCLGREIITTIFALRLYREALVFMRRYETTHAEIQVIEKAALERARKNRRGRLQSKLGKQTPDDYYRRQILQADSYYRDLCGDRAQFVKLAQLYFTAAMAAKAFEIIEE